MFAAAYRNTEAGIRRRMTAQITTAQIVPFPVSPEQARIERERADNIAAMSRQPVPRTTSARELIARVAAWHGMTLDDVLLPNHQVPFVAARVDAMAAVWCNCLLEGKKPTTCSMGRAFKRDHATIFHALRKAGLKQRRAQGRTLREVR